METGLRLMSDKELTRLDIIHKVCEQLLTQVQASRQLKLSTRQIKRLVAAYRKRGADGLVSKQRGTRGNREHADAFKESVMECVRKEYADFGPTLASEKLRERQQLRVNKETLRQWMMEAGLWKGKRRKANVVHQQRARRSCLGELVQIDGSPHDWFEGRRGSCCLLVFIDDATSRLMQLRFEETETTEGYFRATRSYLKCHGRPVAFYNDKHGVFRVNIREARSGTGETQFGRAMRELGIEDICANSPQAKGRVERANSTLQDRLVKELRLRNISDIETANAFLPEFIEDHNKRFAVEAANPTDAHRKSLPAEQVLDLIFSRQTIRTLSKNLEVSYNNVLYQIKTNGQGYGMRHAKITVSESTDGDVTIIYKNKKLAFEIFDKESKAVKIVTSKEVNAAVDGRCKGHKPKAEHPWKRYKKLTLQAS